MFKEAIGCQRYQEREDKTNQTSLALGLSCLMLSMLFLMGGGTEKSVMRNCLQHSAPESHKVSGTVLSMILVLITFVASCHNDTLHNAGTIPLLLLA